MKNGKYVKCSKCKKISYELSMEEFNKQFNSSDTGKYSCPYCENNSFIDVTKEEENNLPDGITISILVKQEEK